MFRTNIKIVFILSAVSGILVASCGETKFSATQKAGSKRPPAESGDARPDPAPVGATNEILTASVAAQGTIDGSKGSECQDQLKELGTETLTGVMANTADLSSYASGAAGAGAIHPRHILGNVPLTGVSNPTLVFVSGSGNAIYRSSSAGIPEIVLGCVTGGGFHIEFTDKDGKILRASVLQIGQFGGAGVAVPAGAVSIWGGFFDDPGTYFDNEPNRVPTSQSTGGCTFTLKLVDNLICKK